MTVRAAGPTGGIETHALEGLVRVGDANELAGYAAAVERLLQAGSARVSSVAVGDDDEPVAVIVGGWPLDGVCCDAPAPQSDDILVGGVGRQLWECAGCGSTVWPDSWAVMPLRRDERAGWDLPEPAHLSWACNVALSHMLFARDAASAAQAQQVLADLRSGAEVGVDVIAAAWQGEHRPSGAVGSVWALVGDRVGSGPAGQLLTGFIGADRNRFDHSRRRWMHGWRDGAWGKVTAAQAAGLLGCGDELARRAADGRLSASQLASVWNAVTEGDVPAWVCDAAAVADLAQDGLGVHAEMRARSEGMSL